MATAWWGGPPGPRGTASSRCCKRRQCLRASDGAHPATYFQLHGRESSTYPLSQKSSGPKTPEGKATSSLNRLSHGFASNVARLIPGENPEEFHSLVTDLMGEHQPATPTEQIL